MKKNVLTLLLLCLLAASSAKGQNSVSTEKVWRVNFLNPAVELEVPTGNASTFSAALGVGYGGAYPDITSDHNGFVYIIAPFLDVQQKWFYNLDKRSNQNKTTEHNSGNFVSVRLLTRGHSITSNVRRHSSVDFAVGPTWGIQRKYGENFHLLFDVGPIFYFDLERGRNVYPIMAQLNLGFDL